MFGLQQAVRSSSRRARYPWFSSLKLDPRRRGALSLVLSFLTIHLTPAWSQERPFAAIQQERLEVLQTIATQETFELVSQMRRQCATGQHPRAVVRSRALGSVAAPDSSDLCPTALARVGRDGRLTTFYRELSLEVGGTGSGFEALPSAIATAVLKSVSTQVPVGNQRAAVITAALALDAGFTVAFQKGDRYSPGLPELAALKPIAERCLGQTEKDLGLCYSTGYVYGIRAFHRMPLAGPG